MEFGHRETIGPFGRVCTRHCAADGNFSTDSVLSTNLNHLASCLTSSITRSNEATLVNSVRKLERICRYLSDTVASLKEQQLDFKFQNVFILIILALKELSAMNMTILPNHKDTFYSMICLSLFHVHVLTQKSGQSVFPVTIMFTII